MPVRSAEAMWHETAPKGHGNVRTGSGALEGAYDFPSRFEEGDGTNPEELIAAAHASCFAMAFSLALGQAGYEVERIEADADVTIEQAKGQPTITRSDLRVTGYVAGIDAEEFRRIAEEAKGGCPVSRALGGVKISLAATLDE